jgi:hypothetical protein
VFTRDIGFVADTVLVDPQVWLISKNNTTQKVAGTNTGNPAVDINPNPVISPMTVFIHDFDASKADIHIVNSAGQLMYKSSIGLVNGAELVTIPTSSWARGMYVVHVKAGGKKIIKRVLL